MRRHMRQHTSAYVSIRLAVGEASVVVEVGVGRLHT
jgi:hypothetical protein